MRMPGWVVPALVVLVTALSLAGSRLLSFPSLTVTYAHEGSPLCTTVFLVDGVRCVDTARQAAEALRDVEGIAHLVAHASRGRVELSFDPTRCSVETLRDALEGPLWDEEARTFRFGLFRVIEIDGRNVDRTP